MKIIFNNGNYLTLVRESNDPKFYGVTKAKGESNLLYFLKTELNKKGFDLIKKRMWKDGHLVDDYQQYLRTATEKSKAPHIYLFNDSFAIRGLEERWNEGTVDVGVIYDVYKKQPNCVEMVKQLLEVQ